MGSKEEKSQNQIFLEHSKEKEDVKKAPPNWKTSLSNRSDKRMPRRFKNPNGTFFQSRIDAIKHMLKENSYREVDINMMKKGLVDEDGWEKSDFLPGGWMLRKFRYKSKPQMRKKYLSPMFDVLKTIDA